ncbi:hypothetical protein Zm00014a_028927 [Zea mays]|uniref:Uncharacterized protein n=1 Tax=Zea mays TaxID=4577 RepID=A0A3L6D725_MAIZE|nr:hypothetical protein Zm00014a_028927 [Zea mays]
MAECSLATLRVRGQYQGRWTWSNSKLNMPIMDPKRNYALKIHLPCQSKAAREWTSVAFTPFGFHGRDHRVETSVKCYCLQPLMDSEGMVSPNLILISDEALLTSAWFLHIWLVELYPLGRHLSCQKSECFSTYSRAKLLSFWDLKFLPERNAAFDPNDMWSEVRNISGSSELDGIRWLQVSTTLIDSLIQPVFMKWIEEEQALENGQINEKLMKTISSKLKEDNKILRRFNRFGKSELYLDMLFFLRFGSARCDSYFDVKFLAEHGERILEDLVISLADVIASIYLELMSVDGDMSAEVVGSSLVLCSLSTRELQKLRNEPTIKLRGQIGGGLHLASLMCLLLIMLTSVHFPSSKKDKGIKSFDWMEVSLQLILRVVRYCHALHKGCYQQSELCGVLLLGVNDWKVSWADFLRD